MLNNNFVYSIYKDKIGKQHLWCFPYKGITLFLGNKMTQRYPADFVDVILLKMVFLLLE